jgi:hypothetical protein
VGKAKGGMTVAEHRENGRRIALLRDQVSRLICIYDARYPHAATKDLERACRLIDQFRSDMDSRLYAEHFNPKKLDFDLAQGYYPDRPGVKWTYGRLPGKKVSL